MSGSVWHVIRHYVEMVIAMFVGMVVLGIPLRSDAPAVALLGMAVIMTVPMVGWMRYRGHGHARRAAEVAA